MTIPLSGSLSTVEPLIDLVTSGIGVVCVPDFTVRRQRADGRLVSLFADHLEHLGTFQAIRPSSASMVAKLRVFVDLVANLLPQRPRARRRSYRHERPQLRFATAP